MADYFIGDIQGCFDELDLLLRQLRFNHQVDHLYLVGDLIGRGPQAQETLDFLISHQSSIHPVLGNHDLHFLAICHGIKKPKDSDKFEQILNSQHLPRYVNYLRHLPLIIELPKHKVIMCHAGISPQWDLITARKQAKDVTDWLIGDQLPTLLSAMYNNDINDWPSCTSPLEKAIFSINSLTRMRYCFNNNKLDFQENDSPSNNTNPSLTPWYTQQINLPTQYKVVFGHWASLLGHTNNPQFIALDTGCLWGEYLTAWALKSNKYFKQKSLQ